jgi:hypothetical protein
MITRLLLVLVLDPSNRVRRRQLGRALQDKEIRELVVHDRFREHDGVGFLDLNSASTRSTSG